MVFKPHLSLAPANQTTSKEIEACNKDSDSTDNTNRVSRFTKTAGLPDTANRYKCGTDDAMGNLNKDFHGVSLAGLSSKRK